MVDGVDWINWRHGGRPLRVSIELLPSGMWRISWLRWDARSDCLVWFPLRSYTSVGTLAEVIHQYRDCAARWRRGERSIPKLVLKSAKAAATTYSFETEGDGFRSWALCTVNDQTGELLITSDWGSWSYRWHASPEALGAPTLTAFIGNRGDVDYLARKLQKEGHGGTCFSAQKTAHELNRLLCARRLEHGREQLERRLEPEDRGRQLGHYTEDGLPRYSHRSVPAPTWRDLTRTEHLPYLTAEKARELWDAIEELGNECDRSSDLFWERLPTIPGFTDYVTDEPWEHGQTEQTFEDKALRDIVLPALIAACKTTEKLLRAGLNSLTGPT